LQVPEGISLMNIDSTGNFICSIDNGWRTIPVWTEDSNKLCQTSLLESQPANDDPTDDFASWIKDMFES
ncbi:MAG: hypothetical protein K7J15_01975, partial [Candidatus Regiella insecticola]|nr:hypothetical protein [Candidatus Regiella insecticola]